MAFLLLNVVILFFGNLAGLTLMRFRLLPSFRDCSIRIFTFNYESVNLAGLISRLFRLPYCVSVYFIMTITGISGSYSLWIVFLALTFLSSASIIYRKEDRWRAISGSKCNITLH